MVCVCVSVCQTEAGLLLWSTIASKRIPDNLQRKTCLKTVFRATDMQGETRNSSSRRLSEAPGIAREATWILSGSISFQRSKCFFASTRIQALCTDPNTITWSSAGSGMKLGLASVCLSALKIFMQYTFQWRSPSGHWFFTFLEHHFLGVKVSANCLVTGMNFSSLISSRKVELLQSPHNTGFGSLS